MTAEEYVVNRLNQLEQDYSDLLLKFNSLAIETSKLKKAIKDFIMEQNDLEVSQGYNRSDDHYVYLSGGITEDDALYPLVMDCMREKDEEKNND